MKLRLRAVAVRNLEAVLDYSVASYGEAAAEAYLTAIDDDALERLRQYRELGALRPKLAPMLRYLPCQAHRVFYLYDGRTISV